MPGFQVNTDELAAGGGQQGVVAAAVGSTAGLVRAAGSAISEGAGHSGASAAGEAWGGAWQAELAARAEVLRRAAANLNAAAEAYRETDDGQMRG